MFHLLVIILTLLSFTHQVCASEKPIKTMTISVEFTNSPYKYPFERPNLKCPNPENKRLCQKFGMPSEEDEHFIPLLDKKTNMKSNDLDKQEILDSLTNIKAIPLSYIIVNGRFKKQNTIIATSTITLHNQKQYPVQLIMASNILSDNEPYWRAIGVIPCQYFQNSREPQKKPSAQTPKESITPHPSDSSHTATYCLIGLGTGVVIYALYKKLYT